MTLFIALSILTLLSSARTEPLWLPVELPVKSPVTLPVTLPVRSAITVPAPTLTMTVESPLTILPLIDTASMCEASTVPKKPVLQTALRAHACSARREPRQQMHSSSLQHYNSCNNTCNNGLSQIVAT